LPLTHRIITLQTTRVCSICISANEIDYMTAYVKGTLFCQMSIHIDAD